MVRFSTISSLPHSMELQSQDCDPVRTKFYGKYQVDDSSFVPMSEAVKRVTGGSLSSEEVRSMYDFSDGRDTGAKIPVDRTHRFSGDIAEASLLLRKQSEKVNEGIKKAKEQFDFEQKLKNIDGVTVDSVVSGSQGGSNGK